MPHFDLQYSDEAQEVLGRIPHWIIRWGVTIILIILLCIITGCYFIKSPQIITSPVIITTLNPPVELISKRTSLIEKIFVSHGDTIHANQPILLLNNTATYSDVYSINDSLNRIPNNDCIQLVHAKWLDSNYTLGDLQTVFLDFKRLCLEYRYYLSLQHISKKQMLLKEQIQKNKEFLKIQYSQLNNIIEEIKLQEVDAKRDSILFKNDIIAQVELEQSFRALIQKRNSQESIEASITNSELSILQKEQQLIELDIQQEQETTNYEREIKKSKQQLQTQIDEWKYQYVLSSPIKGKVVFSKYWANNQAVNTGERLASVIPVNGFNIIARLTVPTVGFGKVERGQIVNVKLNGYPYMEYGILKGYISNISDIPEPEGYIVEVRFPDGLTTTYNKQLDMIQEMDGIAEIITKDERLIEKFIQPIRALFDN